MNKQFNALCDVDIAAYKVGQNFDNLFLRENFIDAWHLWIDTL